MRNRIQEITVTTRNPSGAPGDLGSCEKAGFTIDNETLTLVEGDGTPVRKADGERIAATLRAGESARTVASRLVLARWRSERATGELVPGFGRTLHQTEPYGGY